MQYPALFCDCVHLAWQLAAAVPSEGHAVIDFLELAVVHFAAGLGYLFGLRLNTALLRFVLSRPHVEGAVLVALACSHNWRMQFLALEGPVLASFARVLQNVVFDASCFQAPSVLLGTAFEAVDIAIGLAEQFLCQRMPPRRFQKLPRVHRLKMPSIDVG